LEPSQKGDLSDAPQVGYCSAHLHSVHGQLHRFRPALCLLMNWSSVRKATTFSAILVFKCETVDLALNGPTSYRLFLSAISFQYWQLFYIDCANSFIITVMTTVFVNDLYLI
jgi:hypothetical protein